MKFLLYRKILLLLSLPVLINTCLFGPVTFPWNSSSNPFFVYAGEQSSNFMESPDDGEKRSEDNYNLTIERSLTLKQENLQMDFKMWPDKEEFKICSPEACDKVKIFVQSQKPGYLYLFDTDPNGNLWMLFPNDMMKKSNFIQAEQLIVIPDDYWDMPKWIHETEGLEQIKAVLLPEPITWGSLEKTDGFKRLKRSNEKGLRDISLKMKQLPNLYPNILEANISFFIRKKGNKVIKDKKIPSPEKPIDIIGTTGLDKGRNNN